MHVNTRVSTVLKQTLNNPNKRQTDTPQQHLTVEQKRHYKFLETVKLHCAFSFMLYQLASLAEKHVILITDQSFISRIVEIHLGAVDALNGFKLITKIVSAAA